MNVVIIIISTIQPLNNTIILIITVVSLITNIITVGFDIETLTNEFGDSKPSQQIQELTMGYPRTFEYLEISNTIIFQELHSKPIGSILIVDAQFTWRKSLSEKITDFNESFGDNSN